VALPTTAPILAPAPDPAKALEQARPPNLVTFHAKDVGPPAQWYVGINDQLLVTAQSNLLAGQGLTVDIRILDPNGQIVVEQETVSVGTGYAVSTFSFKLPEGFLLSVDVRSTTAATYRGQCFVNVALVRQIGGGNTLQLGLTRGYVSVFSPVAWPAIPTDFPTLRPGMMRQFTQVAPGAGVDFSITVPSQARWRIIGLRAALTTSATAGTRNVILSFGTSATPWYNAVAQPTQAASLTYGYSFGAGVTTISTAIGTTTLNIITSIPSDLWLGPGTTLQSVTQNIQAGDQWSAIQVGIEECLDI
jgi:hypothetical protein